MTTKVLKIEGMNCENCKAHVEEALSEVAGVESVSVSLQEETATIQMENNIAEDDLIDAIEEAGYGVI